MKQIEPVTMPTPTNPNLFDPPTAEQLARHLAHHPSVNVGSWQSRGPLLLMIAAAGLVMLMLGQPGFALLPLLGLLALMAYLSGQARTTAELHGRATRAWELAMIRRYREALGLAWELLPACRTKPELHGKAVTVIAHILGELRQDEAAEVAYSYLLDRLPPDHPLSLRLKLQRAQAALSNGRLADGDDILRRLRGQAEAGEDPALAAAFQLARLLQDVETGHYAEAIEQAETTTQAMTPLGVESGYGYGLLAFCFHQLSAYDPSADAAKRQHYATRARQLWDQATLLIPASALVYRHHELEPLMGTQAATSSGKSGTRDES